LKGEHASDVPDIPFGGNTIVFGGDFRQILPVVHRGSRADIVNASINSSLLWSNCQVLRLIKNMRVQLCYDQAHNVAIKEFVDWILKIGDGSISHSNDGEADVEIPRDMII
jgi:ATP-dependent DNA helicase PIF1